MFSCRLRFWLARAADGSRNGWSIIDPNDLVSWRKSPGRRQYDASQLACEKSKVNFASRQFDITFWYSRARRRATAAEQTYLRGRAIAHDLLRGLGQLRRLLSLSFALGVLLDRMTVGRGNNARRLSSITAAIVSGVMRLPTDASSSAHRSRVSSTSGWISCSSGQSNHWSNHA